MNCKHCNSETEESWVRWSPKKIQRVYLCPSCNKKTYVSSDLTIEEINAKWHELPVDTYRAVLRCQAIMSRAA